mmetsp:Transcript_7764/g.12030  ORF Transcript_7764/g.12030 Transcript_7764/m.12030 type:complete len:124 (-) Transcript_7764:68-439(-)
MDKSILHGSAKKRGSNAERQAKEAAEAQRIIMQQNEQIIKTGRSIGSNGSSHSHNRQPTNISSVADQKERYDDILQNKTLKGSIKGSERHLSDLSGEPQGSGRGGTKRNKSITRGPEDEDNLD